MEWLGSNWVWLALGVGALALFAFSRGGCGMGHGGHDYGQRGQDDPTDRPRETTAAPLSTARGRMGSDDHASSSTGHAHVPASANADVLAPEHASHGSAPDRTGGRRHSHGC